MTKLEQDALEFIRQLRYPDGFVLSNLWYETMLVTDTICLVYGGMIVESKVDQKDISDQCFSALCMQSPLGIRLLHLNFSCPDLELQELNTAVKGTIKEENIMCNKMIDMAYKQLELKNNEYFNFIENIPASMIRCLHDGSFTILGTSNSFLSLCGYSKEEIENCFQNKFINMIYENDRDTVYRESHTQFRHDENMEIEFRLVCKGGDVIWVMERSKLMKDANGRQITNSILLDITKKKQEQEELRLSLQRHKIIMNQATDIIFEWNIVEDKLYFSSNWFKKFGYMPTTECTTKNFLIAKNIFREDLAALLKLRKDTKAGVPYTETELRIRHNNDTYIWCRIRATTQFDQYKKPIKAVGVISDIDSKKLHEQYLIDQAQKDALTGLYHKAAIQNQVKEHLNCCNEDSKSALLIIDLDHFKSVNDNFGHLCGDNLLSEASAVLKKLFRSTDYIGRIGGDEFLVYMKNVKSKDVVADKAESVQKAFSKITLREMAEPGIKCSIGIAFYPDDATDYIGLYQCADNALYYVKNHGRGNYAYYDFKTKSASFYSELCGSAVGSYIESQIDGVDEALTQYTFRMLYDAVDIKAAISQLLEIIGRAYDVSRVYIFENSADNRYCSNTFEWCNEGVTPQIDILQNISYEEDIEGYWHNFDGKGIFYCQDTKKLSPQLYEMLKQQDIEALLQCAIVDDGQYKGYIGFDECRVNRHWTIHQIRSLSVISNVLSAFLLKQRLKEQLRKFEKYR